MSSSNLGLSKSLLKEIENQNYTTPTPIQSEAIPAIIDRKDVLVESDKVPNPVAVRYAWRNWVVGTLYDTNLLPASSFRTDDWEEATLGER